MITPPHLEGRAFRSTSFRTAWLLGWCKFKGDWVCGRGFLGKVPTGPISIFLGPSLAAECAGLGPR